MNILKPIKTYRSCIEKIKMLLIETKEVLNKWKVTRLE